MQDLQEDPDGGLGDSGLSQRLTRRTPDDVSGDDGLTPHWRRILTDYLLARADGLSMTQKAFVEEHGLNLHTFKQQLYRHGEQVVREIGLRLDAPNKRSSAVQLTERDISLLTRLGYDRCHNLALVARLYFADTQHPAENAMKRLVRLQKAGYVSIDHGQPRLFALTPKGARRVGAATPRPIHPRHLAHHLATLRAIENYRMNLEASGGRLVPTLLPSGHVAEYQLEFHIQAAERSGTGTQAGNHYNVSPDAVVFTEILDLDTGELKNQKVALEYYTAAYSDVQIVSKSIFLKQNDAVHQVADTQATAARVAKITGAVCLTEQR